MINTYDVFAGKFEGMRPHGTHRRRWEDNIRMDLRGTGWKVVDWIHLAHDRDHWWVLVNTKMNLRVLLYGVSSFLFFHNSSYS